MTELKTKTHYVNVRIRTADKEIRSGWISIDIDKNINCSQFAEFLLMAAEAYEAYIKDHPEEGKKSINFIKEYGRKKCDITFMLLENDLRFCTNNEKISDGFKCLNLEEDK